MKMIDMFDLMAKGKIEKGTRIEFEEESYVFDGSSFVDQENDVCLEDDKLITKRFLNLEVELIPPKEKKYLIKVNVSGLDENFTYLNYVRFGKCVALNTHLDSEDFMAHFTKMEMQSIQPVKEFLKDMEGKYELVEVTDNEND